MNKKLFTVRFVSQDEIKVYAFNKVEACKLARIEQKKNRGCQVVAFVRDSNGKII